MKDNYTKSLSPYEQWQLFHYGSYIPEGSIDESDRQEEFPKEPIEIEKINGDDDFNFHPDWCYE